MRRAWPKVIEASWRVRRVVEGGEAARLTAERTGAGVPHRPPGGQARPGRARRPLLAFFAAMAKSERDCIRDKTLEGQEIARTTSKATGGTKFWRHIGAATNQLSKEGARLAPRAGAASRLARRQLWLGGRCPFRWSLPRWAPR